MTYTKTRAWGGALAFALMATTALFVPPAHAATCVNVPGSTPGTNLTIAGDDYRVPAVSGISVCVGDGAVPLVGVETSGGYCTAACLAIVTRGGDVDSGGVTISYRLDGVTTTRTVDPGGVPGLGDSCLLGVGSPQAPRSDCFFAVEPDEGLVDDVEQIVADTVADVERIVGDAGGALDDACDTIPPMEDPDPYSYNRVEFCDDPQLWIQYAGGTVCRVACDGDVLIGAVCRAIERQGIAECHFD
jgi:hypothetical protein